MGMKIEMLKGLTLFVVLGSLVLVGWPVFAQDQVAIPLEHRQYIKQIGDKNIDFDWQLNVVEDDYELVTSLGGSGEDVTRMNRSYETLSWSMKDEAEKTDLIVRRQGNQLIYSGKFKGEQIERSVEVDDAPWYQALSVSLRDFNRQGRKKMEFWGVRPDTLDVHRLQVIRERDDPLVVDGSPCGTVRMKIQLTGFKSVFWSCHYWMRKEDGLFIRYEGPSGPPGWPMTTVELVGSCDQDAGVAFLRP